MRRVRAPVPYDALPPYLGGKRRLAPLICALLAAIRPRASWPQLPFLDPFCGGGAVALTAKACGFDVMASDVATRAACVARALIANHDVTLTRADCWAAARAPAGPGPAAASGVFTPAQAVLLDRGLAYAAAQPEPRRSLLQLVWITSALRVFLGVSLARCRWTGLPLSRGVAPAVHALQLRAAARWGPDFLDIFVPREEPRERPNWR